MIGLRRPPAERPAGGCCKARLSPEEPLSVRNTSITLIEFLFLRKPQRALKELQTGPAR